MILKSRDNHGILCRQKAVFAATILHLTSLIYIFHLIKEKRAVRQKRLTTLCCGQSLFEIVGFDLEITVKNRDQISFIPINCFTHRHLQHRLTLKDIPEG